MAQFMSQMMRQAMTQVLFLKWPLARILADSLICSERDNKTLFFNFRSLRLVKMNTSQSIYKPSSLANNFKAGRTIEIYWGEENWKSTKNATTCALYCNERSHGSIVMKHHPLCFQTQNPEVAYRAQLEQLAQMGFVDRARNIQG